MLRAQDEMQNAGTTKSQGHGVTQRNADFLGHGLESVRTIYMVKESTNEMQNAGTVRRDAGTLWRQRLGVR
jgi:hypothetical protein